MKPKKKVQKHGALKLQLTINYLAYNEMPIEQQRAIQRVKKVFAEGLRKPPDELVNKSMDSAK
jgi:hypothetical protein